MANQSYLNQIIGRVPQWAGRDDIQTSFLGGGITNENVRLDVDGESFVLRLAGEKTALLGIDRQQEFVAHSAAAKIGAAPEVVYFIEPEGYLVTRFVNGRSPTPAEIRQPDAIRQIARLLKQVHALPPISAVFSAFGTVRSYEQTARQVGVQFPARFDNWREKMAEIETAVTATPFPPAFCHNDLLNGNFLRENGRIYLLDWEYAGMGDLYFDLANLAAHHEFDDEQEHWLLASYFGSSSEPQQARLKLMKIMSGFREAMWGMVQTGISQLDFDFSGYARQHFDRMADRMNHPDYPQWLTAVTVIQDQ
ncbi:MAG: phosphotransferase [Anaerolineae bacterium]